MLATFSRYVETPPKVLLGSMTREAVLLSPGLEAKVAVEAEIALGL
jgi:hypothetical protein